MSRRALISPDDARRWVFNRLAGAYRSRPGYPPALIDRLRDLAGGPGGRVADLGAGTGHLAVPLAAGGLRVAAVEPARAMLTELARAAGPHLARIEMVHAAAEATHLPAASFDLVVVADALQWLDPEAGAAEVRRILAPGGALAVVTARLADTPFLRAVAQRIAAANFKARPSPPPVGLFFSLAALPAPAEETLVDEVTLTPPELDAVIRSLSYVGPALGPGALEELLRDVQALATEHGGAAWRRELTLASARSFTARSAPPRRSPRRSAPPRGRRRA